MIVIQIKNSSHITKTELEKLKENLNDTVHDYFNEKIWCTGVSYISNNGDILEIVPCNFNGY